MEVIQIITYIITTISTLLYIDLYHKLVYKRLFLIPILVYLLHVTVFYSIRILVIYTNLYPNYLSHFSFTSWSSALRLQAILTVLLFALILGKYDIAVTAKIKKIINKTEGK